MTTRAAPNLLLWGYHSSATRRAQLLLWSSAHSAAPCPDQAAELRLYHCTIRADRQLSRAGDCHLGAILRRLLMSMAMSKAT